MDWVVLMSSYRVVTLANSEEHHNGNCITEFLMKVCFYLQFSNIQVSNSEREHIFSVYLNWILIIISVKSDN